MISDVLSEAVDELDRYLDSEDWRGFYGSDDALLVRELRALRNTMNEMRVLLDTPPAPLTNMERVAKVAARIRGESVPDWQRRGFLRAEKPSNDERSFGL